jgi:hypothetical protein
MKWLRLFAFTALVLTAVPSFAQEDAAESRATTFQAVEGPQKENVPGGPLLVGAYAFVLVMLVGYVARLGLMQRKTAAEVERLMHAIEQKRKA